MECLKRAREQAPDEDGVRRTRIAIVRNTIGEVRRTTLESIFQWSPPGRAGKYLKHDNIYHLGMNRQGFLDRWILPDNTRVHCQAVMFGLDRPDQQQKLLSFEPTFTWINEFCEIPFQIFTALVSRQGRFPGGNKTTWDGIIMDSNMFDPRSPWYDLFYKPLTEEVKEEMRKIGKEASQPQLFVQPGGLTPEAENIENLPGASPENPMGGRAYYLRMLATNPDKNWVDRYVNAKFTFIMDGTPVYDEYYNDAFHYSDSNLEPVKDIAIGVGIDFGLTPAAIFGQLLPNGQWQILDEICLKNMAADGLARAIKQRMLENGWDNDLVLWCDPAGAKRSEADMNTPFKVLRSEGFKVNKSPIEKTLPRIDCVRSALSRTIAGAPAFRLSRRCQMLRTGFLGGYRWNTKQGETIVYTKNPEPIKNEYSHPHDGLQYLQAPFEGPLIANVSVPQFPRNWSGDGPPPMIRVNKPLDWSPWKR
jgi:hypothetical protein